MSSHVQDRRNYRDHLNSTHPTYCAYHLLAKIQYYYHKTQQSESRNYKHFVEYITIKYH